MTRDNRRHAPLHGAISGALLVFLAGCLGSVETVSDAQIEEALNAGTLEALYQKARQDLQENPKNKDLLENVRKIRVALDAQRKFDEIRATIDRLRTKEGVVPLIVMPSDDREFAAGTNVDEAVAAEDPGSFPGERALSEGAPRVPDGGRKARRSSAREDGSVERAGGGCVG